MTKVVYRHSLIVADDDSSSPIEGTGKHDDEGSVVIKQKKPRFFRNYEKVDSDVSQMDDDDDDDNDGEHHENNNDTTTVEHTTTMDYTSPIKCTDYIAVVVKYPYYRNYLLAHICMHMGDWFVRIASLLMVEELAPESGSSLAMLALTSLLPQALFSQVGGLLSDTFDRRLLMIGFDVTGGIVVLGYLLAIHYKSLDALFFVSTARSAISSTYYPIAYSIVPLLVPDNARDLQLATTLNQGAKCATAILGGTVAGTATAYIGLRACYMIDSVTFFVSALFLLLGISGNYCVASTIEHSERRTWCESLRRVINHFGEVYCYLWNSGFGSLIFLKASATIIWGAEDVVGAEFATVDGDEAQSSINMGMLFSFIGFGSLVGPLLVNTFTDANRPITVQRAIWIAFCILTCGWTFISTCQTFHQFLFGSMFRTMGSGVAWPYSTLLLQTLCKKEILGRVLSVDYMVARGAEAISAQISGALSDAGFSKQQVALFGASLGFSCSIFWGIYHFVFRQGAAQPRFNSSGGDPTRHNHHVVEVAEDRHGIELKPPPPLEKDLKMKELEIL